MGDPLFKIYDKSKLIILAKIEEEDIPNIKLHDEAVVVPDAYPNATLKAKVISIYNKVDESNRLLPVRLEVVENADNLELLPGMTVSTTFSGHQQQYSVVPPGAIQQDAKKSYVETKRKAKVYLQDR